MNPSTLQQELDESGEVMITVEEFEEPIAMHLHDTEIDEETVRIDLADGTLTLGVDNISGYWIHKHSLSQYGLE